MLANGRFSPRNHLQNRSRSQNLSFRVWFLSLLVKTIFFGLIFFTLVTFILFILFAKDLPSPNKLTQREMVLSTKIFDRNGKLLYDIFGDQNRTMVELSDVPQSLKDATIAIEDKDFYKHSGFQIRGMARAVFEIVVHRSLQGGSTLTQQLVKNSLLSQERTITRKLKEFVLALQVERRYEKDQILKMYLNEVPYGGTAWGVESASQMYFAKKTKELNLTESAILAGLPQRPTAYSPYGANPKAYIARAGEVLRRMREDGYITSKDEEAAKKELPNIKFAPQGSDIKAPHFVMYVKEQLVSQFGEKMVEQGGLQVTTTLDMDVQEAAQKAVTEEIDKLKQAKVGNGAAVVLSAKTGEILAMVGSKNYFAKDYDGNVNVVLSYRQPGSSTKPINYATAFKKGYTPATMLIDERTEFDDGPDKPKYVPVNYDGKFHGPVQVRFALGNSFNIPAVKMLAVNGIKDVMQTAYEMGIESWKPTSENLSKVGLSLTLGGREVRLLDLASAFSVFADGGMAQQPVSILKVTDQRGKVLTEYQSSSGKRVLSSEISFLISHMLLDNNARMAAFGPSSYLVIPGRTVAVKTGTTDEKRDNWTIGYTPSYTVGVWVGNNDNSPMAPSVTSGVTGAAPIWHRIMTAVLKDKPVEEFVKPDKVIALEVDALSGLLPGSYTEKRRSEYFIEGTQPTRADDMHRKTDDKLQLVLYDPYTKLFCPNGKCPGSMSETPQLASDGSPVSKVTFVNVVDGANVPLEFDVLAKAPSETTKVTFFWDDVIVSQTSSEPYAYHVKVDRGGVGDHRLRVEAVNDQGQMDSQTITVHVKEKL